MTSESHSKYARQNSINVSHYIKQGHGKKQQHIYEQ